MVEDNTNADIANADIAIAPNNNEALVATETAEAPVAPEVQEVPESLIAPVTEEKTETVKIKA